MFSRLIRTKLLSNSSPISIVRNDSSTFSRLKVNMSSSSHPNEALVASKLFTLKGQKAVVTGGGSGIGLMITQALVANGADVFIVGRTEEKLKTVVKKYSAKGGPDAGKITPLPADINNKDSILALRDQLSKLAPEGINLLVNNAGVAKEQAFSFSKDPPDTSSVESLSEHMLKSNFDAWQDTFKTNVTAHFFLAAALAPLIKKGIEKTGSGAGIVNITSISGMLKTSSGGQFAYACSKAASIELTYVLGTALKETGIRVNSIAPGIFPSEMTEGSSDENQKSKLKQSSAEGIPAGRTGSDEDMAAAILLLAGPGGAFFNGQILHPDGGNLLSSPSSK